MIKQYSLKADGETFIAKNFRVREFACKDGEDFILIDENLVSILQAIRSHFGKAVQITSAYRTPAHNKKTGGVANSRHLSGMAADIAITGVKPTDIAAYAEKLMMYGGIGIYDWGVHIDTRPGVSRWKG